MGRIRNTVGLSKEEAKKRNYFDILGRHLKHIIYVNLLYALSNILFFGASICLFIAYFSGDNFVDTISTFLNGQFVILPIVPFLPLMLTGPFTAGFTYVIRNFAKQEHAFIFSDFFEHSKNNLKYGLLTSILQYLILYLLIEALVFYNAQFMTASLPTGFLYAIFFIALALYIIMSFYIYPLMVTFKMSFKVILKNAWTFTIMKLPQNLLILIFLLAIHIGLIYLTCFVWLFPEIYALLLVIILMGFTSFTANYYIWHVLDKYIVRFVTPNDTEDEDDDEQN